MKKITIIGDFCYPNFAGDEQTCVRFAHVSSPNTTVMYACSPGVVIPIPQYAADDPGAAGKYDALKKRGNIRELSGMGLF